MIVPLDRGQQLHHWLTQLDDPIADLRCEALTGLESLSRPELNQFLTQLHTRKLTPAQVQALSEVYQYVNVRASFDFAPTASGFMGVNLDNADPFASDGAGGALIAGRLMGFVAYRYLSDGDVVIAIGTDHPTETVRNGDDLRNYVMSHRAGEMISLRVIRGGRVMNVMFAIDSRPVVESAVRSEDSSMARSLEAQQLSQNVEQVRINAQRTWDDEIAPALQYLPAVQTNPAISEKKSS